MEAGTWDRDRFGFSVPGVLFQTLNLKYKEKTIERVGFMLYFSLILEDIEHALVT